MSDSMENISKNRRSALTKEDNIGIHGIEDCHDQQPQFMVHWYHPAGTLHPATTPCISVRMNVDSSFQPTGIEHASCMPSNCGTYIYIYATV